MQRSQKTFKDVSISFPYVFQHVLRYYDKECALNLHSSYKYIFFKSNKIILHITAIQHLFAQMS